MKTFDVSAEVLITFQVEAETAERAEWLIRHSFDSRHSTDGLAGTRVKLHSSIADASATVMTCVYRAGVDLIETVETSA